MRYQKLKQRNQNSYKITAKPNTKKQRYQNNFIYNRDTKYRTTSLK